MIGSREKRSFVRWRIQRPVRYKVASPKNDEAEEKMALLRDISFSGAQISLLENVRLNENMDLLLEITGEENPIPCQGKIVWQDFLQEQDKRHFICGVTFTKLEDRDKEKIFKCVWNSAPDELKRRWWESRK